MEYLELFILGWLIISYWGWSKKLTKSENRAINARRFPGGR